MRQYLDYNIERDIEIAKAILNLNELELAEMIGIHRTTFNKWALGDVDPSDRNIRKFYTTIYEQNGRLNMIKEQFYREELEKSGRRLLFHGAKSSIFGELSLSYSKEINDFGAGFYCGDNMEQSIMFVSNIDNSSLYMLAFDETGLKGKKYYVDQDWMMLIAYYRKRLEEYKDTVFLKAIIEDSEGYDYYIAPIADNRMFEIINSFIEGEITDEQCKHCLSATNLGYQYVMKTEKALEHVEVLEHCFLPGAEKEDYIKKRLKSFNISKDKEKFARIEYKNKGKYLEELL